MRFDIFCQVIASLKITSNKFQSVKSKCPGYVRAAYVYKLYYIPEMGPRKDGANWM